MLKIYFLDFLFSVNGHEKNSIQTYGMVTGLLNGGLAFGAMVGPVVVWNGSNNGEAFNKITL